MSATTQGTLPFDIAPATTGQQAAAAGIARAAAARPGLLDLARKVAREVALSRPDRTVTADDVVARLVAMGYGEHELGRAAGAVFRGKCWEFTGARTRSQRAWGHGNELKIWRLVDTRRPTATAATQTTVAPAAPPAPAASPEATDYQVGDHCPRCGKPTPDRDIAIHDGASTRRERARCCFHKGFPRWNPPKILGLLAKGREGER